MVVERMNKKGVEIGNAIYAIVGFSMFIVAIGIIISEYEDQYNTGITNDLGEYNKLDELSSLAENQRNSISPNTPDPSENAEANTFRGGYGIITGTLSSLNLIFGSTGMVQSITTRFGIPAYVTQGFIIFMIIGLVFSVIAIVFRLSRSRA